MFQVYNFCTVCMGAHFLASHIFDSALKGIDVYLSNPGQRLCIPLAVWTVTAGVIQSPYMKFCVLCS